MSDKKCQKFSLKKLTNRHWLNLFEVVYHRGDKTEKKWMMCSRKNNPVKHADKADAVYIVAVVKSKDGNRLVVTREFRVPIWDYEYGFAAGLIEDGASIEETVKKELKEETGMDLVEIKHISPPVYSSAGMTDESCVMVFAEVTGSISNEYLQDNEDIETFLFDIEDIRWILASKEKISSKAWGIFYHYDKLGKIDI